MIIFQGDQATWNFTTNPILGHVTIISSVIYL